MRAAPAVDYPLACSGFWRGAAALVTGVAFAAGGAWAAAWLQAGPAGTMALMTLAAGALGTVLGWHGSRPRPARLGWDGQRWHLRTGNGPAEPGLPVLALDWGAWVLLRWHADAKGWRLARWLPLARRERPGHWHALRVALQAAQPLAGSAP